MSSRTARWAVLTLGVKQLSVLVTAIILLVSLVTSLQHRIAVCRGIRPASR